MNTHFLQKNAHDLLNAINTHNFRAQNSSPVSAQNKCFSISQSQSEDATKLAARDEIKCESNSRSSPREQFDDKQSILLNKVNDGKSYQMSHNNLSFKEDNLATLSPSAISDLRKDSCKNSSRIELRSSPSFSEW